MISQEEIKKKIQIQNLIIVALAIIILVLVAVSGTAAWYIRTKSDSTDIVLSNPVNIYITEFDTDDKENFVHTETQNILDKYKGKVYPGDKVKLNLGMRIGSKNEESSPAYVRVKLEMAFSKINDPDQTVIELEHLASSNLIEYKNKPNESEWKLIDFNKFNYVEGEEYVPDFWYVLKTTDSKGVDSARIAHNMEYLIFLNGFIKFSKDKLNNEHANCKVFIKYVVEAMQVAHVPDPIQNEGYGPWWNFVLGDEDDLDNGITN